MDIRLEANQTRGIVPAQLVRPPSRLQAHDKHVGRRIT